MKPEVEQLDYDAMTLDFSDLPKAEEESEDINVPHTVEQDE